MKAHVSLVLLALTACGGGDDDGASTDSGPQVELTAEDILDALLEVDGDGSGLDADSVDGLQGDELARAGQRVQSLPLGDGSIPEAEISQLIANFRIPPDAVAGEPLLFDVIGMVSTGGPCTLRLTATGEAVRHGELDDVVDGVIEGGATSGTLSDTTPYQVHVTFDDPSFVPGDWGVVVLSRDFDHAGDTCTASFNLLGVSLEYTGR